MTQETILIVDGNSLVFRAFHALPLLTSGEYYTNAVQGFFSMLFKVIREQQPLYCAVCFDEHAPTFRHEKYKEYKAGRKPTPPELLSQFPLVRELLTAMGVGVYSLPGFEADDLLGTFARQSAEKGYAVLLLTGDRDALQLVDNSTRLLFTKKGISETMLFTPETVKEVYGVTPEQVPDLKGLMGDTSDHIIGVPGVGEKTAVKLLEQYETVENVITHADDVKGKLGEKLAAGSESAAFSKWLATICRTAPITLDFEACRLNKMKNGMAALDKYHLSQLKNRLSELCRLNAAEEIAPAAVEEKVFAPYIQLTSVKALSQIASGLTNTPFALHLAEAMTLALPDGTSYRMCFSAQDLFTQGPDPHEVLCALLPALQGGKAIVHDVKALLHLLSDEHLPLPSSFGWDTMLAAYLLNPQEPGYSLGRFTSGQEDAQALFRLYTRQVPEIEKLGMHDLLFHMELPLARVLFDMEYEGFGVDRHVLEALGETFKAQIEALREEVYKETGVPGFNINSPQQLGKVLFETMGLPTGKKTKSGYSTSADILEALAETTPVVGKVLEYRQVVKLYGTYIEGLIKLIDKTGRVHTTFDQTATATGRISSNEPNLQNIPVRTPQGREIRRAFIPRDGWVLVDADYSQIELRVLAHMSRDPHMIEAFTLGQDVHTRTAAEVYGVAMDAVTPQMRSSAKAVNFGLVYGISEFGLSRNIGISRKEAADFIARYFERYPGVHTFMDEAVAKGKMNGHTDTLFGRRRMLPELTSGKPALRAFGERAAMNTPVQGTAADIIKLAMVKVQNALSEKKLRSRLILQVHDELILECPPEEKEEAVLLLKDCMENVTTLAVPLVAEVHTGSSWYETK